MDVSCLNNKHTEGLVTKPYFQEWLRLNTKINLPLIYYSFVLKLLNIILFTLFDNTYIWIENNLLDSNECHVSANNVSCVQHFYSFMKDGCSKWTIYICMACLLGVNITSLGLDFHTGYISFTKYESVWKTSKVRKPLVHRVAYSLLGQLSRVSIILNVVLRFLKNENGVDIPTWVDNLIYYCVYFGFTWNILFLAQLIPYIGYIAVVMKLMVKDTVIVILFISMYCIPYSQLFPRIINHKTAMDECDSEWKDIQTTTYNLFLLLFNLFNFKTIEDDKSLQVQVSSK